MKPVARLALALAAIGGTGAAAAAGYGLWHRATGFEATDNAYVRGDVTFVAARVAGYAVEVAKENNERVAAYETLVRIDPRDIRAAVLEAEAALGQRRAALVEHEAQVERQRAQIEVARSAVQSAQAEAERVRDDLGRATELVERAVTSRQRYDEARAADVVARSVVAQRASELRYQEKQLDALAAQRVSREADVASADATLYSARIRLEDTRVWSPLDGLVAARNVRAGEYVNAGTRLYAVVPVDGLWVEANYRETQIGRMRPGDRAEVRIDALPGALFCGTVESLSGASGSEFAVIPPDNATGNFTKIVRRFPVRIRLDADQPGLDAVRVGMSVVPRAALGSAADGRARASGLDRLAAIAGGGGRFACGSDGPVRLDPPPRRRLPEHPGVGAEAAGAEATRPGGGAPPRDGAAGQEGPR